MSRIGKEPINIGKDVKVDIKGNIVNVQGPKGKLAFNHHSAVKVEVVDQNIVVTRLSEEKLAKSLHGTTRAIVANMVKGVIEGYKKELEIIGVGYKAQMQGTDLVLRIGFSHLVEIKVPDGLKISTPALTRIIVEGIDKEKVGQLAANIRKIYPPEPYKGKGIRYLGEVVRKKLGKAMAK